MVKSRRPLLPASPSSLSSPSSPSLSFISRPPHLKPSSASCSPFISSLRRCPLLDVHSNFSALSINSSQAIESIKLADHLLDLEAPDPSGGGRPRCEEGSLLISSAAQADGEGSKRPPVSGRARLQQHRIQVGGKVMIPDTWGLEQHLPEWVSFGLVEEAFKPAGLLSARSALMADCQRRPRGSTSQPTKAADPVEVSSCG